MRSSETVLVERRTRRRFWRTWAVLMVAGVGVVWAAGALPAETTATTHDVEWRHLDPTTTTRPPSTTVRPAIEAATGHVVIVDGDRAWRIPHTPLVAAVLRLAYLIGATQ